MSKKMQLHMSGLAQLWKCGIAYERRYLIGDKTPASVNLIVGTAVHKGIATDLEHKRETGQAALLSDVKDITRDSLVQEMAAQEVAESPEDVDDGFSKAAAVDKAVDLAELAHHEAVPGLFMGKDPAKMHVERQWTLDVEGLPFQLAGTIDVQQGSEYLLDWKTSGKSPNKDTAMISPQLTMYAMATKVIDGVAPKEMGLNFLVKTPKRGDTKLVELRTERDESDYHPLLARIKLAHEQIESGVFHPAPMDSWWCHQKWCSYHSTCAYSSKRTLITIGQGA